MYVKIALLCQTALPSFINAERRAVQVKHLFRPLFDKPIKAVTRKIIGMVFALWITSVGIFSHVIRGELVVLLFVSGLRVFLFLFSE